jgi:hypothetical protein
MLMEMAILTPGFSLIMKVRRTLEEVIVKWS